MAGLKEIRTRISSIKTTRQVTSAMKMVSAAKLKRAQDAIIHFRPYASKLYQILSDIARSSECLSGSDWCAPREVKRVLLVVISSNRGLCGGFNMNIAKQTEILIATKYANQHAAGMVDILAIGKQTERLLRSLGYSQMVNNNDIWHELDYDKAEKVVAEIMAQYASFQYDRVELVYNEFVNAVVQMPVSRQLLPIQLDIKETGKESDDLMLYEPTRREIIQALIPKILKVEFYRALLDSHAAEHGARMTSMHMATDNATVLIGDLSLVYNKARQASITKEILEITGGAEALRNS